MRAYMVEMEEEGLLEVCVLVLFPFLQLTSLP